MKKLFSTFTIVVVAVLINNANAQHKSLISVSNTFTYDANGNATDVADINTKALKDFGKYFKNVSNEKWCTVSDGFFADFNDDGIDTKLLMTKKEHGIVQFACLMKWSCLSL